MRKTFRNEETGKLLDGKNRVKFGKTKTLEKWERSGCTAMSRGRDETGCRNRRNIQ